MSTAPSTSGGPAAIRGYLVQTLVALLDIAQADPPFAEITLEPAHADDQFDFVWTDANGAFAVQVKSTVNQFRKAEVESWARKLQAARNNEKCRLILVGNYHPSLAEIDNIDSVGIEKKNLDLGGLFAQAAHQIAKFMQAQGLDPSTPDEHEWIAEILVTRLLRLSAGRLSFTRDAFIKLLTSWVTNAPRRKRLIDISRIIKYAPAELIGREVETKILNDSWDKTVRCEKKRTHILTIVALGGEGKTSLVAKWATELAHEDWPGCEAVFAWSFYSQGSRAQTVISTDLFLKEALCFFGDPAMAASAQGAFEKGRRLAQIIGERRALIFLDGVEPLQYPPTSPTPGEFKDQGLAALLKGLAASNHGLCVVTTWYSIRDLRAYWQTTAPETRLLRLSKDAGVALLQKLGVRKESGSKVEFENLVEDVKGHALTLNLFASYLQDAHAGDIRKRDLVKLEEADAEEQGGHAFRVMDAYVGWLGGSNLAATTEVERRTAAVGKRALAILRLLGLFDCPATADCIAALLKPAAIPNLTEPLVWTSDAHRNVTFTRLEAAKLLMVNRDATGMLLSLDTHRLIRDYFANQLRKQHPEAWRAAHKRLYEYLFAATKDKIKPKLEDLQPLYQAVAHGCQAGMQQEACNLYYTRIQRGHESYSTKRLGALGSDLGAVANFFGHLWSSVSDSLKEADQAWLLNEAAFRLRALGRLNEALEPMRAALKMRIKHQNWMNATITSLNLIELELSLGMVEEAVADGEQSVIYADRSGEASERISGRASYGDALHQAGRRGEAEAFFNEATKMQAERQNQVPLLYSGAGIRFCNLLLANYECTAWRQCIFPDVEHTTLNRDDSALRVYEHASQALKIAERNHLLLDTAVYRLTLGRVALYTAILERSAIVNAVTEIDQAVHELRRASQQNYIPVGLLKRAWLRILIGARTGPESAVNDLDEAWEIAERGPMRLLLAEVHLYRARLFFRDALYPWDKNLDGTQRGPKDDLDAAEKLINDCGYHRRDEELADAKRAILG